MTITATQLQEMADHRYHTVAGAQGDVRALVGVVREARRIVRQERDRHDAFRAQFDGPICDCPWCLEAAAWLAGEAREREESKP